MFFITDRYRLTRVSFGNRGYVKMATTYSENAYATQNGNACYRLLPWLQM